METRFRSGCWLALSLLCLSAGCESKPGDIVSLQSPVKLNDQALEAEVAAAKATLEDQKQALVNESKKKLAQLDVKIESLKAAAGVRSDQAKEAADSSLGELTKKRDEARAALSRAQGASRDSWEALKSSASQALESAEQTYNQTLEKLKRD